MAATYCANVHALRTRTGGRQTGAGSSPHCPAPPVRPAASSLQNCAKHAESAISAIDSFGRARPRGLEPSGTGRAGARQQPIPPSVVESASSDSKDGVERCPPARAKVRASEICSSESAGRARGGTPSAWRHPSRPRTARQQMSSTCHRAHDESNEVGLGMRPVQGPRTWVDGGWREAHTLPVTSLGSAKPRAGTAPVQRRQQRVPEQLVRQPQLGLQRAPAPEHRREPVEPTTTRALLGRLWQLRPRGQAPLAGTRRAARPRTWRAAAAAARVQAQPCARRETCAYHLLE
jgi:hypothetical protein